MQITAVNAKASVGNRRSMKNKKSKKFRAQFSLNVNTTLGLFFCGSVVLKNTDSFIEQ